ncbi:MAG: hypothetical protein LBU32_24875 [Clostridiales bacterium]|nr:hypothetical protein [Clostridiales bacterium]
MGILAVYDTIGIQNYIFSSNKLAENVGASKLVAGIFKETLPQVIKESIEPNLPKWTECLDKPLNPNLKVEIIYQGGGNAFVAFEDDDAFQIVTKAFLTEGSRQALGVGIAVSAIETDFGDTYKADFEKLNKRLAIVKGGFNIPVFAGSQPITKQSNRTGLPVSVFEKGKKGESGEYLSQSQKQKRENYLIYKTLSYTKTEIDDFDDLAFDKGADSLIAIIHADGNNMGNRIKTFMERPEFDSYAKAVPAMRELSVKIDACYKKAREKTIEAFRLKFDEKYNDRKIVPYMELIGDGDDTTLVISGRFALDFAARLLREIEVQPDPFQDNVPPTACAGVVLFHSHYPFSEAYKLAEGLCGNAKSPSRNDPGSYIDFHLHQSGGVSSLSDIREKLYTVDGKSILRRPWRVTSGQAGNLPSFSWFENTQRLISDDHNNNENRRRFPNSKLKGLRNAIGLGDSAAELAENTLRGEKLPIIELSVEEQGKISRYASAFDVLEMLDIYENLLNTDIEGGEESGE